MDTSKEAVNIFDRHADAYTQKYMDVSIYATSLDLFCNSITCDNAVILDVACGPGNLSKYLLGRRPDFKLYGIDLSPRMISIAKFNNPGADFEIMDARDLSLIERKFDGIICGFCLPYLSKHEVEKLINQSSQFLKPNGMFYLSMIKGDPDKSGVKQTSTGEEIYINYYTAEYVRSVLEDNYFNVFNLEEVVTEDSTNASVVDLIIISRKKSGS